MRNSQGTLLAAQTNNARKSQGQNQQKLLRFFRGLSENLSCFPLSKRNSSKLLTIQVGLEGGQPPKNPPHTLCSTSKLKPVDICCRSSFRFGPWLESGSHQSTLPPKFARNWEKKATRHADVRTSFVHMIHAGSKHGLPHSSWEVHGARPRQERSKARCCMCLIGIKHKKDVLSFGLIHDVAKMQGLVFHRPCRSW